MEYSQTVIMESDNLTVSCLNPYSNGILTDANHGEPSISIAVLILILMEYSQT